MAWLRTLSSLLPVYHYLSIVPNRLAIVEELLVAMIRLDDCIRNVVVCTRISSAADNRWGGGNSRRTDVVAEIPAGQHLHAEVLLDAADDLDAVSEDKVCVLHEVRESERESKARNVLY